MSYTFQTSPQKQEHSEGSLLFGAFLGAISPEISMVMDAAEVASEFHAYNQEKQPKGNFELGKKKSLDGPFARGVANENAKPPTGAELNGYQKRYTPELSYQPRRGMAMGMAA